MFIYKIYKHSKMTEDNLKSRANKYLDKKDYEKCMEIVGDTFKLTAINSKQTILTEELICILGDLLSRAIVLIAIEPEERVVLLAEHIFKALRNSTVTNENAQNWVATNKTILEDTYTFCKLFRTVDETYIISCVKILLQFLNNLVVKNRESSRIVWYKFKEFLGDFIVDKNYSYFSSALAYNMLYTAVSMLKDNEHILKSIFEVYKDYESNEYLHFLLELFVKNTEMNITYVNYDSEHRLLFLTMVKDLLQEEKLIIGDNLCQVFAQQFKKKSDCILKTVTQYLNDIEPLEVMLLLDILSMITSEENLLRSVQNDKSLLINCVFLLKSVHEVSKLPNNNFTVMGKLSDLSATTSAQMFTHPSYGFKASLIRLLGNLCWHDKGNQDEVRELDGIPLLLDCCNMDARNPFIIQWVVFAIRNLCENNEENQKVIAAMNKVGVVDHGTLEEMGMTLNNDGENSIKILPFSAIEKHKN